MKLIQKLKNNKTIEYIFLGLISIAVVAVLAFSLVKPASTEAYEDDEVISYVKDLENRLEKTLSEIKGAGNVSVVITVDSGKETIYASEKVNGKPVVVKENYPEIVGVLIVAQGANSISVMKNIQQAAVSLLNINLSRIEILAMN